MFEHFFAFLLVVMRTLVIIRTTMQRTIAIATFTLSRNRLSDSHLLLTQVATMRHSLISNEKNV